MKCAESWLREWVNPEISRVALSHELTMAGLEVEELVPVEDASLDDVVFDISITPNRGDCLSVRGIAREISAITNTNISEPKRQAIKSVQGLGIPIENKESRDCPRYVGRVIQNIRSDFSSPAWLIKRLQECGIRVINPIVDVTNYVMLELGQPMHAFDLDKIHQGIIVRKSKKGEKITLLDSAEVVLDNNTLVIADHHQALAIAGVMGGLDSGVTSLSKNILLESAYFSPQTIARQRQHYHLHSESSYRFERGVDPQIQVQAMERATQLILEMAGGEAGEVIELVSENDLPKPVTIVLPMTKLKRMLGIEIKQEDIKKIIERLNCKLLENATAIKSKTVAIPEGIIEETEVMTKLFSNTTGDPAALTVSIPSWRFDLRIAEDLVEEIARLYGYDNIPVHTMQSSLQTKINEKDLSLLAVKQALNHQGYHETISYSFVDQAHQALFGTDSQPIELLNPITSEMSVMRSSLWPGLVTTFAYNKSRQQDRIRLFEAGTCFLKQGETLIQRPMLAGLMAGHHEPEQWGIPSRRADFYDLKGMLENLLGMAGDKSPLIFKADRHPALHPGQTASICLGEQKVGILGALHPNVMERLDFSKDTSDRIFVFELDLSLFARPRPPRFQEVSRFPEIRRDIALLVDQAVPSQIIRDIIIKIAGDWLKDVFIFDVYQGKGISPGLKSIALALVFQHPTRTLVDAEITEVVEQVIAALKGQLGAELRS